MRRISLKFIVGLLALVIGIFVVWASGIVQVFFPQPAPAPSNVTETILASAATNEEAGKIVIRFKGFELTKDWTANFEIVNYTAQPIT